MIRAILVSFAIAGCYGPVETACSVTCSDEDPCPNGSSCFDDGYCHTPDDEPVCFHQLSIETSGPGEIIGDVPCNGTCSVQRAGSIALSAHPGLSSLLDHWTLDGVPLELCDGIDCPTAIDMSTDHQLVAVFQLGKTVTMSFTGDGHGVVKSQAPGIRCDPDDPTRCEGRFLPGTQLVLEPHPTFPSLFLKWTGACQATPSSTDNCSITVDDDVAVGMDSDVTTVELTAAPDLGSIAIEVPLDPALGGGTAIQTCASSGQLTTSCTVLFPPGDMTPRTIAASVNNPTIDEFVTWFNACAGAPDVATCQQTFTQDVTVFALFAEQPSLTISNLGTGGAIDVRNRLTNAVVLHVPQNQILSKFIPTNTLLGLDATGAGGIHFLTWGPAGCPSGGDTTPCDFRMRGSRLIQPVFGIKLTLNVNPTNTGTIAVNGDNINACHDTCTMSVPASTATIKLQATGSGAGFSGWGGCPVMPNPATDPCVFPVTGDVAVTGNFFN